MPTTEIRRTDATSTGPATSFPYSSRYAPLAAPCASFQDRYLAAFQREVRKADAAGLLAAIDRVGCVVCAAELGDVVAFDTRVYHATAPYAGERRVASGIYAHYPETPAETAITGMVLGGGGPQWEAWRRNKVASPFRRRREELMKRLQNAASNRGYRLERQPDGETDLVRL